MSVMRLWLKASRRVASAMVWILREASSSVHVKAMKTPDVAHAKELRAEADELHAISKQIKETLDQDPSQ